MYHRDDDQLLLECVNSICMLVFVDACNIIRFDHHHKAVQHHASKIFLDVRIFIQCGQIIITVYCMYSIFSKLLVACFQNMDGDK